VESAIIKLIHEHPHGHPIEVTLPNSEVWEINGECGRCGACCRTLGCTHVVGDMVIDGVVKSSCGIYWIRPANCLIYPVDPRVDLEPTCGYWWRRVK